MPSGETDHGSASSRSLRGGPPITEVTHALTRPPVVVFAALLLEFLLLTAGLGTFLFKLPGQFNSKPLSSLPFFFGVVRLARPFFLLDAVRIQKSIVATPPDA